MGADIVGYRQCPLQDELGPEEFFVKVKLRGYKEVIEARVPEEKRATIPIVVRVGDSRRMLHYLDICEEVAGFEEGIPECAECPLSGGAPVGCYHSITYPVDAAFERLVFDFFVEQLPRKDSICDQIYRDIIARIPADGTGWHVRRGGEGGQGLLAELAEPLVHTWGKRGAKRRIDSAQILQALFIPLEHPALVVAYCRLFSELIELADQRGEEDALAGSRTLAEVRRLKPFFFEMLEGAIEEGWVVLTDA